jgi:hypothetical protein
MIIKHDTRRFLQSPFPADFGYDGLRAFDTSFSVCLTTPFKYTGRDVLYRSRRFELWSPNSSQLPVYPGLPPANFNMVPPLQYPRVDGSGGRFDWTLNPQHFDTSRLHLPFIMTPEHASIASPYLAEFTYLTSVWISHPLPAKTHGTLSPTFLTALSQRAAALEDERVAATCEIPACWTYLNSLVSETPTIEVLSSLGVEMEWEECISRVTAIQRQLREKQAWLNMFRALRSTYWKTDIALSADGIRPARESFIGCWVNGAREESIRWLLHLGIPCFIIHEYRVGVDFGVGVHECRSRHVSESFCPTNVWHLRADINAYDFVAKRCGTSFATADQVAIGSSALAGADALARSASHFHGYRRAEEDILAENPEEGSIHWPLTILSPDRIPWVKPPPISTVLAETGKWTHFAEEIIEHEGSPLHGCTVMVNRGYHFRDRHNWGYGPYFDRTHKRQLWFESLDSVPGLVSDDKFGRPVPFYQFVKTPVGKQPPATTFRSTWMYKTLRPSPGDAGLEPTPPLQTELPRFTNILPPTNYDPNDEENGINPQVLSPSPLSASDEPMMVEEEPPIFLCNAKEPSATIQPSPSVSPANLLPSVQEISMEPLRPSTPPMTSEPSSPHSIHPSPPSSLPNGDVIEDPISECHGTSLNHSHHVTPSPEEVAISGSDSHREALTSPNSTPPLPMQSTIVLCTDPPHKPSSGRFVVLDGVDSRTTEAEIAARLCKPIVPDPKLSGCGVLVRACARLLTTPGDKYTAFMVECESEEDAALVCCVLDGRLIGNNIAGVRLAPDDLVQTAKLQPCDNPSSAITSRPPSSLRRQSLSRPSKHLHRSRLGKSHSFNLLHHQSYWRLVSDRDPGIRGQGTLPSLSRSQSYRQGQSAGINNAAARLRIARRQGRTLLDSPNGSVTQAFDMTIRHIEALGDYVRSVGSSSSSRLGL